MTENEKQNITQLRTQGFGYKAIAKKLNIPLSSVASFIRRKESSKEHITCKHCGKKLIQTKGHRQKIFCSDSCRRAWWKENPDKRNLFSYYDCICKECGIHFKSYSKHDRKYCSLDCYNKSRNSRGGHYGT